MVASISGVFIGISTDEVVLIQVLFTGVDARGSPR